MIIYQKRKGEGKKEILIDLNKGKKIKKVEREDCQNLEQEMKVVADLTFINRKKNLENSYNI